MKITDIHIQHHRIDVEPPYPAAWDSVPRGSFAASIVRVETDAGVVGIGSGDTCFGFEEAYKQYFIGQDLDDIDHLHGMLNNIAFHHSRCWPIDLAFWDARGKAAGQSVASMLGAKTDKVPLYCSTGSLRSAQALSHEAKQRVAEGYRAIKLRFGRADWRDDVAVAEAVRDAVGPDIDLMVDMNQGWRMPWDTQAPKPWDEVAEIEKALRPVGIYWLEEALHRADVDGYVRLRKQAHCRLSGGEMTREVYEGEALLKAGALDVYQQDCALVGGITGLMAFAEKVRAHGAVFTPHTWGNGIQLLANAHLLAATFPDAYLEYPLDPPEWTEASRDFLQAKPVVPINGFMSVETGPGLGFALGGAYA